MDFSSISIILLGSTLGLILRILIQNNFKRSIGFDIQNISIVNFLIFPSEFAISISFTGKSAKDKRDKNENIDRNNPNKKFLFIMETFN